MTAFGLLTSNITNISHFYNLTLFICQLFGDGHFRVGHVMHDTQVFDNNFITQTEAICPYQIPWQMMDIDKTPVPSDKQHEPTDHILQMIFLSPNKLAADIDRFHEHFTMYRVFIFAVYSEW